MSPAVKAHFERHGWKWTSAGIVAIAGTVGAVLLSVCTTVTKMEATLYPQGPPAPVEQVATVSYVNEQLDARCPLPKKHHRKAAAPPAPQPPPKREGLFRRLWHVLI